MAYQTGTAADVQDLAGKLAAFAVTNGWIQDGTYVDAGLQQNVFYLHSGPTYVAILGDMNDASGTWLYGQGGTGYDPSGNGSLIEQSDWACGCNFVVTPIVEYHMFVTNQYIHCAFLGGDGIWNNFMMGELVKTCDFVGGTYGCGTNFSSATYTGGARRSSAYYSTHAYPFDSYGLGGANGAYCFVNANRDGPNKWFAFYSTIGADNAAGGGYRIEGFNDVDVLESGTAPYTITSGLMARSINQFNGLTILHNMLVSVMYDSGYYSYIGYPNDLKTVNLKYLNAKDIITIGGEDWMVFPAKSKQYVDTYTCYSDTIGYAYRRNA